MKKLLLVVFLFIPSLAYADKYEDMQSGLREILIALSQVNVLGKDAATLSAVQQGLSKISKDVGELQTEYKATQDEVVACKEAKDEKSK